MQTKRLLATLQYISLWKQIFTVGENDTTPYCFCDILQVAIGGIENEKKHF